MSLMNEMPPETGQESRFYHLLEAVSCAPGVPSLGPHVPCETLEVVPNDSQDLFLVLTF